MKSSEYKSSETPWLNMTDGLYYNREDYMTGLIQRIETGITLNIEEIEELVEWFGIETVDICEEKWNIKTKTIISLNEQTFAIIWYRGFAGSGSDGEYFDEEESQPFSVKKNTYKKVITVTDWVKNKI